MLTEILPVKLTNDELRERGVALADVFEEIADQRADAKSQAESSKDAVKALETQAGKLARVIRSGQEDREVQVEEIKDWEAQEVRTVRLDTSEVVHRRAMTPRELQRPLPIGGEKSPITFEDIEEAKAEEGS